MRRCLGLFVLWWWMASAVADERLWRGKVVVCWDGGLICDMMGGATIIRRYRRCVVVGYNFVGLRESIVK